MLDQDYFNKIYELDSVFSPSAPIKSKDLFSGRLYQIARLFDAITQKGEHVVIYGERGVGKTSLANIIPEINMIDVSSIKVTCSKSDNFIGIWKRVLQKLKISHNKLPVGFNTQENIIEQSLNEMINDTKINPGTVLNLLSQINENVVLIFDEYDSIMNPKVKAQFADIIKDLSDNNEKITIIIVGIGYNVSELIGDHKSLERCLKQIQIPRMSNRELEEIILKGLQKLKLKITDNAKQLIINYSIGFPHFTHLLTKYSAKTALTNESLLISRLHFNYAMTEVLENTNHSIKGAYYRAISTNMRESKFEGVVAACTMAPVGDQGDFKITDVVDKYSKIIGREAKRQEIIYNLGKLCQSERGELLEKVGKGFYRFKNPLVKAFIRLKLYHEGKLN